MGGLHYEIAPEIFDRFPGYVRGVVVAHGVSNGPAPEALVAMLREAEASVRERLSLEGLAEHPRIKPWREAYRAFGAKPSEFRSSIEALAPCLAERAASVHQRPGGHRHHRLPAAPDPGGRPCH